MKGVKFMAKYPANYSSSWFSFYIIYLKYIFGYSICQIINENNRIFSLNIIYRFFWTFPEFIFLVQIRQCWFSRFLACSFDWSMYGPWFRITEFTLSHRLSCLTLIRYSWNTFGICWKSPLELVFKLRFYCFCHFTRD